MSEVEAQTGLEIGFFVVMGVVEINGYVDATDRAGFGQIRCGLLMINPDSCMSTVNSCQIVDD